MNLTRLAINRPSLIIVLFSIFTLVGIIGFKNLSYELMPDFNQPVVVIKTVYPGANPDEVEFSVSQRIEKALSHLEGVDYLLTKSLANASVVIAHLNYGVDLDNAMRDAQRYIDNIRHELPAEVLNPVMSKVSPNDLPMMSASLTSNLEPKVFYQHLEDQILPQLQQLRGVAEITVLGAVEREIQVNISNQKLKHYGISLLQVSEAINRAGLDVPAGNIQNMQHSYGIKLNNKFHSLHDLAQIQLPIPHQGTPILLQDVAEIVDGTKTMESYSRYNGSSGVGLLIKKQNDGNAIEVSRRLQKKFAELEQQYAAMELNIAISDDNSQNTVDAVNSVVFDLILAVILVSLVMLLFLGSYRNSLIVIVAIPTSLITAFGAMWILGYTLNLMTLLAMSLVIGVLVDDATVIIENIQRHLGMGKDKVSAAYEGRMEIGFSALSITLVDVVVFVPILFLQVFVADMLKQFSVVVIVTVLTSLLVSFTLTPFMASRMGAKTELKGDNIFNRILRGFAHYLEKLTEVYTNILQWVLAHPKSFLFIVLLLFMSTAAVMKQNIIGPELMATGDQGKFNMNLEFAKDASLNYNNEVTAQIEEHILKNDAVATVFSNIGGPSAGIGSLGVGVDYISELTIQLKDKKETGIASTDRFMRDLRTDLQKSFPQVNFAVNLLGLVPKSAPIEITLSGADLDHLYTTAESLRQVIATIPGADNARLSVEQGAPELQVIPQNDKMQRLGLNSAWVGMNLRAAFAGMDQATFTENGYEHPIRVQLSDLDRNSVHSLSQLTVVNPLGLALELGQFADIVQDFAPTLLERKDRQNAITITANTLGRPSGSVASDVVKYLKQNPLPAGVEMTWGGDIKMQNQNFTALGSVLIISFILIYLILVALYDNYIFPLVALLAIPTAVIGALWALNLSVTNLSVFALLGMIMLMGLVTKNSILIVDFSNQLRRSGVELKTAVVQAASGRLRPILMTTISMVVGLLPIALGTGTSAEWKNGLAWVLIGGLLSSLMLTVFLVPLAYQKVAQLLKD